MSEEVAERKDEPSSPEEEMEEELVVDANEDDDVMVQENGTAKEEKADEAVVDAAQKELAEKVEDGGFCICSSGIVPSSLIVGLRCCSGTVNCKLDWS